jgi:membrane-bound lytic murein transglycosylase F
MIHAIRRGISATILPVALVIAGCSEQAPEKNSAGIGNPEETGILQVATRNGSTTYYLNRHENPTGPEFSLISQFAESKGWAVEWTMYDSTAEVMNALESGGTHLAAAGLG